MGETTAKLRQIFDLTETQKGIFFFDEFDSIDAERSRDNDVGEMRRVLSSFLQFIEQSSSESLILVATNNPEILDKALFRRFNDILFFERPNNEAREALLKNILSQYVTKGFDYNKLATVSEGLSRQYGILNAVQAGVCDLGMDSKYVDVDVLTTAFQDKQANIHNRTAELGYYIGENYWGKGICTVAVELICRYIFNNTDIIRIYAEPFATNIASCRVLEKAGFLYEGTLRNSAIKKDEIIDIEMYAILR